MPSPPPTKNSNIIFILFGAILISGTSLVLFGWLAVEILEPETTQFDSSLLRAVHSIASPTTTTLMNAASFLGSAAVLSALTALVILVLAYFHRYRSAVVLGVIMLGTAILNSALKYAFHRPRPIPYFGTAPDSFSFPSGHALGSLCFFVTLAAILSSQISSRPLKLFIWSAAILLTATIGFSRIYLGVHYPSDVLAGYCAALFWVAAVFYSNKLFTRSPTP